MPMRNCGFFPCSKFVATLTPFFAFNSGDFGVHVWYLRGANSFVPAVVAMLLPIHFL